MRPSVSFLSLSLPNIHKNSFCLIVSLSLLIVQITLILFALFVFTNTFTFLSLSFSTVFKYFIPSVPPKFTLSTEGIQDNFTENFNSQITDYHGICSQNLVLQRGDGIGEESEEKRKWSLHPLTYPPRQLLNTPIEYCDSIDTLIMSLQMGQRRRIPSNPLLPPLPDSINPFTDLSTFIPHGCHYRWFSSPSLCDIFSQFSSVIFVGDSLVRHTLQAMFMALSGDLEFGGIARGAEFDDPLTWSNCRCDGIFSEHSSCRHAESVRIFRDFQFVQQAGICQNSPHFSLKWISSWRDDIIKMNDLACYINPQMKEFHKKDHRPVLIYYSVGVHWRCDSSDLWNNALRKRILFFNQMKWKCPDGRDIKFVFGGMGKQTKQNDIKYPHQNTTYVHKFNDFIRSHLQSSGNNLPVYFLDWFNSSYNAPASDGLHYLSDQNLLRAQYLANLAYLVLKK